jgi:EpsD family peptidyl-prolyl cis-trans isomerase
MIQRQAPSLIGLRFTPLCATLAAFVLVAGCGGDGKDKPSTQTAARVNKEEVTVHQINAVLAQQRGLRPEQADDAARRALERLVDQELAVQKAAELKIDRNPRVVQQLEAARREIVNSAYREKLGEGAAKPTAGEIKAYYDQHPALFSRRKVYQVNEVVIQADAGQLDALRAKLAAAKSLDEFVAYLKGGGFKFTANQAVRAAEQVPLGLLPQLAEMKDGGSLFNVSPDGALVIHLAASRAQPVDLERASPAIEQFLLNDRKRKIVADDLKALRAASKIEYLGKSMSRRSTRAWGLTRVPRRPATSWRRMLWSRQQAAPMRQPSRRGWASNEPGLATALLRMGAVRGGAGRGDSGERSGERGAPARNPVPPRTRRHHPDHSVPGAGPFA